MKRIFSIFLSILLILSLFGCTRKEQNNVVTNSSMENSKQDESTDNIVEKPNVFSGNCGITAVAEMGTDIIGQSTITISITNTTSTDISAIKFYVVPFDVYGEEINSIFTTNSLITDDTIFAGKSDTRTWQFLDNNVKSVKLYVYSVYFSDGTEWGDRNAIESVILNNALEIDVEGIDSQFETTDNFENNSNTNTFEGDCGISAVAEMGIDIIGQPTLTISITNTTNKDISAIQFYAIPLDVYGEEINSIFTINSLVTDDAILAGNSDTRTWQFLDNNVKTVKLYVYSVFFSDGSEWGNRNAIESVILKNALEIVVNGNNG